MRRDATDSTPPIIFAPPITLVLTRQSRSCLNPGMTPLDRAIKHFDGVTKLALAIEVGQSVVSNWRARGTVLDPIYCAAIERATKGKVTRKQLRPKDWQAIWPELADKAGA